MEKLYDRLRYRRFFHFIWFFSSFFWIYLFIYLFIADSASMRCCLVGDQVVMWCGAGWLAYTTIFSREMTWCWTREGLGHSNERENYLRSYIYIYMFLGWWWVSLRCRRGAKFVAPTIFLPSFGPAADYIAKQNKRTLAVRYRYSPNLCDCWDY